MAVPDHPIGPRLGHGRPNCRDRINLHGEGTGDRGPVCDFQSRLRYTPLLKEASTSWGGVVACSLIRERSAPNSACRW